MHPHLRSLIYIPRFIGFSFFLFVLEEKDLYIVLVRSPCTTFDHPRTITYWPGLGFLFFSFGAFTLHNQRSYPLLYNRTTERPWQTEIHTFSSRPLGYRLYASFTLFIYSLFARPFLPLLCARSRCVLRCVSCCLISICEVGCLGVGEGKEESKKCEYL